MKTWKESFKDFVRSDEYFSETYVKRVKNLESFIEQLLSEVEQQTKEQVIAEILEKMPKERDILVKSQDFCDCFFNPASPFCRYAQGFNDSLSETKATLLKVIKGE